VPVPDTALDVGTAGRRRTRRRARTRIGNDRRNDRPRRPVGHQGAGLALRGRGP